MSNPKTKDEIKAHKDESLSSLSDFLNKLIESEIPSDPKRADLISYWLKDFQQYISQEKSFDESKRNVLSPGTIMGYNAIVRQISDLFLKKISMILLLLMCR